MNKDKIESLKNEMYALSAGIFVGNILPFIGIKETGLAAIVLMILIYTADKTFKYLNN